MENANIQVEPQENPAAGIDPEHLGELQTEKDPEEVSTELHEDTVVTENERAYASALRKIFGISESEELGSVEDRIAKLKKKNADIAEKAKESVIAAEIRAMRGYDAKLLDRLIDRSKITIDENGRVTGFEEAVKAVEEEFPSVHLPEKTDRPFVPVNPAAGGTAAGRTMNDLIRGKR